MQHQLAILARLSNGRKFAVRVNTADVTEYFNSPAVLNEQVFFRIISDNKYEFTHQSDDAESGVDGANIPFAPYWYGLLLFDFFEQNLFACNYKHGFMEDDPAPGPVAVEGWVIHQGRGEAFVRAARKHCEVNGFLSREDRKEWDWYEEGE